MLEHFLTSGVLISGIFLIRSLLGSHMQQRIKYALWLLVLAKLLLPVLSFETPYGIMRMVYAVSGYGGTQNQAIANPAGLRATGEKVGTHNNPGPGTGDASPAGQQPSGTTLQEIYKPNIKQLCCLIWAAVSGLFMACLLGANIRFARRLHNCRQKVLAGLYPLSIYETDAVSGPCLAGILHPAIYLPVGFSKGDVHMGHIIAHEYMHYRHKDHIWALLRCVCVSVYWFRPLVWAAAFASAKDGELACDEAAISYLGEQERQNYGRTLIRAATYGGRLSFSLPYAAHAGGKNMEIKERISMIVKKPKSAAVTCMILLCAVVFLSGAAFGHTDIKEGEYKAVTIQQSPKTDTEKDVKKVAWEYQVEANADGYFLDVTDCRQEGGAYVLVGTSYADTAIVFTNQEKKRLDRGETVILSCDGASQAYTLSKSTDAGPDGNYLLTVGHMAVGMDLQKGQYGDRKGWVLSDPYSGIAWQPLLKEAESLAVAADTPVEVNNYYAYYEMFSSLFTANVPGKGPENGPGQQWAMKQYFSQYLKNIKKIAQHGDWSGDTFARVRVTGDGSSMRLIDFYLP